MPEMKHLKEKAEYQYSSPSKEILDTFPNPGVVRVALKCLEVTSVCPKTGQPDYEEVLVVYYPNDLCLESKSLKLYLGAFRQEGLFGETMARYICNDLSEVLQPKYMTVTLEAKPRGGISIGCTAEYYSPMPDNTGAGLTSTPPLPPTTEGK